MDSCSRVADGPRAARQVYIMKSRSILSLTGIGLVAVVALSISTNASAAAGSNESPIAINLSDLKFTPDVDEPCLSGATVRGDPAKGPSTGVYRVTKECTIPMHWHSSAESLVMISGVGTVTMKGRNPVKLQRGGFFFQPAHQIGAGRFPRGALFVVTFEGPVDTHYVDDTGKEISRDQALNQSKAK
jgi:quercetin dioxygenase-like cupin family protein